MTRGTKHRLPSPELSPLSSASETLKHKHHRKIPKFLQSPPYQPDSEDDDDEQPTSVTSTHSQFPLSLSPNSASNSPNSPKPISQIDSYINIAPFPSFSGNSTECPAKHLSRFSKVCRANNVSSTETVMKIFPVTLENEAALWYDLTIDPYPSLTWEEIKSSFMDAYRKPYYHNDLRFELMNLNQEQGESVRSYFLRLQWILHQWPENEIPDPLIKVIFVDGLRRDFKDWIIPQKPESLADVVRLAFTWEQVRIIKSGNKKNNLKCGFCDGESHVKSKCEIRGRMREWCINSEEHKRFGDSLEKNETGDGSGDEETEEDLLSARDSRSEGRKEEAEGVVNKSGCQCSKHQCGKKRVERNKSIQTR